jgi:hypothetical protein
MAEIDLNTLEPVNNTAAKQFEVQLGDRKAVIVYMINGRNIVMHHTEGRGNSKARESLEN